MDMCEAGGKAELVAGRTKWTKFAYKKLVAEMTEKGQVRMRAGVCAVCPRPHMGTLVRG